MVLTMQEGMKQYENSNNDIHCIKYEELTANPKAELKKLLDFCELEVDKKFNDYALGVLKPAPVHPRFDLNKTILPVFEETMFKLDYY